MATLKRLKHALKIAVTFTPEDMTEPLTFEQSSRALKLLKSGKGNETYNDFIAPHLTQVVSDLLKSKSRITVLEIGPGPTRILEKLLPHQRSRIRSYTAYEPNEIFASALRQGLDNRGPDPPFAHLDLGLSRIHIHPFGNLTEKQSTYDLILFCHSMYGMPKKAEVITEAAKLLTERGRIVFFHREGVELPGLVCQQTASWPTSLVSIPDEDQAVDLFVSYLLGRSTQDGLLRKMLRRVCREEAIQYDKFPNKLSYRAPERMFVFRKYADVALWELLIDVPAIEVSDMPKIKNWEAGLHRPAAVIQPTEVKHIQECVKWAIRYEVGLTVIGGSHSAHCLQPNVVAIDMRAFNDIEIFSEFCERGTQDRWTCMTAGAGCKAEELVREAEAQGKVVPLGSRPSVGAGLWLQGGIGHLSRIYGLTCDSILGAIVVSVETGDVYVVGSVPAHHRPKGAYRSDNEEELLWALRGAGTNMGIVVSVTFKAHEAPTWTAKTAILPFEHSADAFQQLSRYNTLAARITPAEAMDSFIYSENGRLHLGVTEFVIMWKTPERTKTITADNMFGELCWKQTGVIKNVDNIGLFDADLYVSKLHGGHAGGRTSSFKRCVFLKDLSKSNVADKLVKAIENRPAEMCYMHILHGGAYAAESKVSASAFGCRDWNFACVITGIWRREEDGTEVAQSAIDWVYRVAMDLLPSSDGVYAADLGPDPRDIALAARAFGENGPRLGRIKNQFDPHAVLRYACPLPFPQEARQKVILLITGKEGAGKDYCAKVWEETFQSWKLSAKVVSISEATKREYAAESGADLGRLINDRKYKEEHRTALKAFYQDQLRERPHLPEDHFLAVTKDIGNAEVLMVTGLRDEAPVATLSSLVPHCHVIEVRIEASEAVRNFRRGFQPSSNSGSGTNQDSVSCATYQPDLVFTNDRSGDTIEAFAKKLIPCLPHEFDALAAFVRAVKSHPRPEITFRHVTGIAQHKDGLRQCTHLLRRHYRGDWNGLDAIVCCEAGGIVFAAPLALEMDKPLVIIRKAGKLPPPTLVQPRSESYISDHEYDERYFEMEQGVLGPKSSVLIIDDVLSSGETMTAMIQLLMKAGVDIERMSAMVVAEFPVHGARKKLLDKGFGIFEIQSLLVYDGP